MNQQELNGVAYLCCHDECEGFTGLLITQDRQQYSLRGRSHSHNHSHQHRGIKDQDHKEIEDEDHHTCCYDDSDQALDLVVDPLTDLGEEIIFRKVMKCGGDNFSLVSKHVNFITDELLVDQKADACITKFFSSDLLGKGCFVCIGQFKVKYSTGDSDR